MTATIPEQAVEAAANIEQGSNEKGRAIDVIVGYKAAAKAALEAALPLVGWREFLEDVIKTDQKEKIIFIEADPAGNTYKVTTIDGPLARRARVFLSPAPASPQPREDDKS